MTVRERWIAIVLATIGGGMCLVSLGTFIVTIRNNFLPWYPGLSARDHYIAVGRSYGQGFGAGFFICFFLMLAAAAVGSWVHERRSRSRLQPAHRIGVHRKAG